MFIAISASLPSAILSKGLDEIIKESENRENRVDQKSKDIFEEKNYINDSSSLSNHLKTMLTLTPIAVSISFILTLSYYTWALDNNIGQAFTITSLRFSQDKYQIIPATLMILFTLYLSFIPLLIIKPPFSWQHPYFLATKDRWIEDLNICTSMTLKIAGITLLVGIPASLTFHFLQPTDYAVNIHGFTTLTFLYYRQGLLYQHFQTNMKYLKNYSPLSRALKDRFPY